MMLRGGRAMMKRVRDVLREQVVEGAEEVYT
jgi:hypothetical protein